MMYKCIFNRLVDTFEAATPLEARDKAQKRWGISDINVYHVVVFDEAGERVGMGELFQPIGEGGGDIIMP
jgi:hypothetical protein